MANIFARVTGGNPSQILGGLGTRQQLADGTFLNTSSNLFLMNPSGIIFGQGAQLDVGGSFAATTANAIGFGDLGSFSATNPSAPSELLTINPSVFLFDAITGQNQGIVVRSQTTGLQVPDGRSLLLVGGNVNLDGGKLNAFGGRVELGGLAKAGSIELTISDNDLQLSFPAEVVLADVSLTNASNITTLGDIGGGIAMNAQNISILNNSSLNPGISPGLGEFGAKAGDVNLNATGTVILNTSLIFGAIAGIGNGSNINITGQNVNIINAGLVSASLGQGDAGNVSIQAKDTIFFKGGLILTNILSGTQAGFPEFPGIGNSGDINLEAKSILLSDGAAISTSSLGLGKSGNIRAIARDNLTAKNGSALSTSTSGQGDAGSILIQAENQVRFEGIKGDVRSGVSSQVFTSPNTLNFTNPRRGGDIRVETSMLSIADGAAIDSSTLGRGDAGNIFVQVKESISLENYSFISSSVSPTGIGNAGSIIIEAKQLAVRDGSQILSATFGNGNAGDLTIQKAELVEIDGGSATDTGLFTQVGGKVGSPSVGTVGNLTLETNQLVLRNGGQVNATIFGRGTGSDNRLTIRASDIQLIGTTAIPGRTGIQPSAIQTRIEPFGNGEASDLIIETNRLSVRDGARIAADIEQSGQGRAGNILIRASESVEITGSSTILPTQVSQLTTSINQGAVGRAGDLTVETKQLFLQDGALISASSQGQGNAGNIFINVSNRLEADNGTISTSAARSSGGDIFINTKMGFDKSIVILRQDSDITTNSRGDGGNIIIGGVAVVALDDSDIISRSTEAKGGNITLTNFFSQTLPPGSAENFDQNGQVDLNASGRISSGIITLPDLSFLQNGLNQLPNTQIDTNALLANSCIVRTPNRNNSFYVTGSSSLPLRPGDPPAVPYPTGELRATVVGRRSQESVQSLGYRENGGKRATRLSSPMACINCPMGN